MDEKEKAAPMKTLSFRVPTELYERVAEAVKKSQDNQTAWLRNAVEYALDNMGVQKQNSSKEELLNLLANDDAVEELLYHKLAEKIKLKDIIAEFADFATHFQTYSTADLNIYLREMAARIKFLIPDSSPRGRLISDDVVNCSIEWKKQWTLEDFISLSPEEIAEYEIFHMECRDPKNSDRAVGIYIWDYYEDAMSYFKDNYFNPNECVVILGGTISSDTIIKNLPSRIVNMIRYVAHDNHIGTAAKIEDPNYLTYNILQAGMFPAGIPYEFTFGWVSEAWNTGYYESVEKFQNALIKGEDKTVHPEVSARWHYTKPEEKRYGLENQTPFLRHAVPENIINGRYVDENNEGIPRIVKPILEKYDDPGRVDREGYPQKPKK